MSLEAVRAIGEAEESARRIRAEAALKAEKLREDAEAAGRAAIRAAEKKAAEELSELRVKAAEKATADAQELYNSTENKKAVLRARAEARLPAAAALIVERIVSLSWPF